jgi:5-formyltetrahydrofolate cyclo-ligase
MTQRLEKSRLREILKTRRAAIDPDRRRAASAAILDRLMRLEYVRSGRVFFVYVSVEPEVSTRTLIDLLEARGRTVLVPKLVKNEGMEAVRFPGWSNMRPGGLGIPSPLDTRAFSAEIDVVVVPGLGFTVRGDRIGYGAGHYDRWFGRHQPRHKIALAFDAQMVERLPIDPNDIRVDAIATETRVIETRKTRVGFKDN